MVKDMKERFGKISQKTCGLPKIAAKGLGLTFHWSSQEFGNHSCLSEQGERATSENAFKRLPCIDSKLLLRLR